MRNFRERKFRIGQRVFAKHLHNSGIVIHVWPGAVEIWCGVLGLQHVDQDYCELETMTKTERRAWYDEIEKSNGRFNICGGPRR